MAKRKVEQFSKRDDQVAIIHEKNAQRKRKKERERRRKDIKMNETCKCMNAHQNNFFACFLYIPILFTLSTSVKQKLLRLITAVYKRPRVWRRLLEWVCE